MIDERTGRLVAGHGRRDALLALKQNGHPPPDGIQVDEHGNWFAPVIRGWRSKNDREADAYWLASNRLTEAGGWHEDALAEILAELRDADALSGLGFDDAFLTKLLDDQGTKAGNTDPDDVPVEPKASLRGDGVTAAPSKNYAPSGCRAPAEPDRTRRTPTSDHPCGLIGN
ncbi:MAG: hypothetical protein ACT4TC_19760 [Myxococcaceae bacterium]